MNIIQRVPTVWETQRDLEFILACCMYRGLCPFQPFGRSSLLDPSLRQPWLLPQILPRGLRRLSCPFLRQRSGTIGIKSCIRRSASAACRARSSSCRTPASAPARAPARAAQWGAQRPSALRTRSRAPSSCARPHPWLLMVYRVAMSSWRNSATHLARYARFMSSNDKTRKL